MKTELKYGIILGLGICSYTLLAHFLGFYTTNIQAGKFGDMIVILLPIAVLFLAIREKRRTQGFLTLFGGIKTGVLVGLVSFPISVSFLWIYHHYINPDWLEFIIDYERSAMISASIGAEEISSRIDALRIGNSDSAQLIGGFIGTLVLALIFSLIFSIFLRTRRERSS